MTVLEAGMVSRYLDLLLRLLTIDSCRGQGCRHQYCDLMRRFRGVYRAGSKAISRAAAVSQASARGQVRSPHRTRVRSGAPNVYVSVYELT